MLLFVSDEVGGVGFWVLGWGGGGGGGGVPMCLRTALPVTQKTEVLLVTILCVCV